MKKSTILTAVLFAFVLMVFTSCGSEATEETIVPATDTTTAVVAKCDTAKCDTTCTKTTVETVTVKK